MDKKTKQEQIEEMASDIDTQKGAIMTSSICDLPLTVEGLRKTVDEITRLNRVETELQELNAKYYNEAKDLRRELKQARKETAKELAEKLKQAICDNTYPYFDKDGKPVNIWNTDGFDKIDELLKQYGVEVEE